MCFWAPYDEPGTGASSSDIVVVNVAGGPYTANEEVKITLTPGLVCRSMSRICLVESMF